MKVGLNLVNLQAKKAEGCQVDKSYGNVNTVSSASFEGVSKLSADAIKAARIDDINLIRPLGFSRAITFTGNSAKNLNQIASIAPECQGVLNGLYKVGGLGNVAGEASVAFSDKGGADIRTFIPYYAPDNADGKIKVRTPLMVGGKQAEWDVPKFDTKGKQILNEQSKPVLEKRPAYTFKAVDQKYKLAEGENFVLHEPVVGGKEWTTPFKILEDVDVSGSIKSINEDITALDEVPYRMFKVAETGTKSKPTVYVMHTPEIAKFQKAYNIGSKAVEGAYAGGAFEDKIYADFSKTVVDALPKMNNDKFGTYNPASFWLHDRQAFPSLVDMADKSASGDGYWNGVRAHATYHNPGRDYQGHYRNPLDFMRIIGNEKDLEALKKHPEYNTIQEAVKKIKTIRDEGQKFSPEDILSSDELKKLDDIFKPMFGSFVDELGDYNLCEIPVAAVDANPYNMSKGTVSTNYGKEMKNHNTKEIAPGLTRDLARTQSIDIVNGSTPASLQLDQIGHFGKAGNGFTEEIKKGFKPLTEDVMRDKDKLFDTKQANKKWIIDTIADASEKGNKGLAELFFDPKSIEDGSGVFGEFSKFNKGDTLFVGWGRGDSQKGFPTTLEAFLQFFKDPEINESTKLKTKALIGAGWADKEAPDFKMIKSQMEEIAKIDGGKYAKNICYVDGFFSNRVVACADFSIITSRYEPCGITPLESFAGGTPVISNNTGGSPDFIKQYVKGENAKGATGILTKHAYLVNPEVIGADSALKGVELDNARRIALGKENVACIKDAIDLVENNKDTYKEMADNCAKLPIDWDNNEAFNGGKTAMKRYFEDVWHFDDKFKEVDGYERNVEPLQKLKGMFSASQGYSADSPAAFNANINTKNIEKAIADNTEATKTGFASIESAIKNGSDNANSLLSFLGSQKGKIGLAVGAAAVVIGGAWAYISRENNKKEEAEENEMKAAEYTPSAPVYSEPQIAQPPVQTPVPSAPQSSFDNYLIKK